MGLTGRHAPIPTVGAHPPRHTRTAHGVLIASACIGRPLACCLRIHVPPGRQRSYEEQRTGGRAAATGRRIAQPRRASPPDAVRLRGRGTSLGSLFLECARARPEGRPRRHGPRASAWGGCAGPGGAMLSIGSTGATARAQSSATAASQAPARRRGAKHAGAKHAPGAVRGPRSAPWPARRVPCRPLASASPTSSWTRAPAARRHQASRGPLAGVLAPTLSPLRPRARETPPGT